MFGPNREPRWPLVCATVLALVAGSHAQVEFQWIDAHGQPRTARKAEDVPRGDWRTVTVKVKGAEAIDGERFKTTEGLTVSIEGVQAPAVAQDGTAASRGGAESRARLDQLVKDQPLTLEFEGDRRLPDGDYLAHAVDDGGTLLSETMLEEGRVRLCLEENAMRHARDLTAAQLRARRSKAGVWARQPRPPPTRPLDPAFHRGVSLGLYAQSPQFDYSGFLNEIRSVGASHVLLSSPWLMEDWQANDSRPVEGRSAGWSTIERVTSQATQRGLAVAYLPLVLLRTGTDLYWRGNIQPAQRWLWLRNYGRLIGTWADVAEDLGVSLLCVGSEFSSLDTDDRPWRVIIANVRSRFGGRLTYSANWDHIEDIAFWDALDLVGMTAYFELTKKDRPGVDELLTAWAPIKERLLALQAKLKKPILFTEVGYPAQSGANRQPWNYYLHRETRHEEPDPLEQADCFQALFKTWGDTPPGFAGLYVWNWWRHEDPKTDLGYSVFGRPAHGVIQKSFRQLARRDLALRVVPFLLGLPARLLHGRVERTPATAPQPK